MKYEGNNQEHFEKPDQVDKAEWLERGALYRGWDGHEYKVVSYHSECGVHMQRVGECDGKCYEGYGYKPEESGPVPRPNCSEFRCISGRAIDRTYHRVRPHANSLTS
jgi:hypothetical protein